MEKETTFGKFSIKDYEKELLRELKMRERMWKKTGVNKFQDFTKQRQYDILEELMNILMMAPWSTFETMRKQAESASRTIQTGFDGYGF